MTSSKLQLELSNYSIKTPLGRATLSLWKETKIVYFNWKSQPLGIEPAGPSPLIQEASRQIYAYFEKKIEIFDLPLDAEGTVFQKQVWDLVNKIKFGKTKSYKEISIELTRASSARAVGNALAKNPICLLIPCHRVVNASGELGNYSAGPERKKYLLELESKVQ